MIKKTLRNAVAGTAAVGALLIPTATTISPQLERMACRYPNSIVTDTELIYPTLIRERTNRKARANADGKGGPNGVMRFSIPALGLTRTKTVANGRPVKFSFGKRLKAGRTYTLKAKFFGNCRYRHSSDQVVVTVLPR